MISARKCLKSYAIIFVCLLSNKTISNESQFLPGTNLNDFFEAAIEFSPELQIASENLNISSARKQAAKGLLLPQLSAGANVSDNKLVQFNRQQVL